MTSLNPPMTRCSTPPVALGASKPTVALTPSKASYAANLSLPCPLSLFVPPSPQVYHVYTEDPHVYTKVRPLMPNLPLPSLLSPAYSGSPAPLPLSIASSGPLCLRLRFYCTLRRLYLRSRQMHLGPRRFLRPRPLYLHQSLLCLQVIHSREAFGNSDFRVFNSLVRV